MKRGSSCSSGATHQIPSSPSPPPFLTIKWTESYWVTGNREGVGSWEVKSYKEKTKQAKQINKQHSSFQSFWGSNSKSHNHFELDSMVHNLGMYCIPFLSLIIVKPKGRTIGKDVQVIKLEIQNHTVTAVLTVQSWAHTTSPWHIK